MKAKANGVNSDQHNQLMDEFKKAHQRMFKGGRSVDEEVVSDGGYEGGVVMEICWILYKYM